MLPSHCIKLQIHFVSIYRIGDIDIFVLFVSVEIFACTILQSLFQMNSSANADLRQLLSSSIKSLSGTTSFMENASLSSRKDSFSGISASSQDSDNSFTENVSLRPRQDSFSGIHCSESMDEEYLDGCMLSPVLSQKEYSSDDCDENESFLGNTKTPPRVNDLCTTPERPTHPSREPIKRKGLVRVTNQGRERLRDNLQTRFHPQQPSSSIPLRRSNTAPAVSASLFAPSVGSSSLQWDHDARRALTALVKNAFPFAKSVRELKEDMPQYLKYMQLVREYYKKGEWVTSNGESVPQTVLLKTAAMVFYNRTLKDKRSSYASRRLTPDSLQTVFGEGINNIVSARSSSSSTGVQGVQLTPASSSQRSFSGCSTDVQGVPSTPATGGDTAGRSVISSLTPTTASTNSGTGNNIPAAVSRRRLFKGLKIGDLVTNKADPLKTWVVESLGRGSVRVRSTDGGPQFIWNSDECKSCIRSGVLEDCCSCVESCSFNCTNFLHGWECTDTTCRFAVCGNRFPVQAKLVFVAECRVRKKGQGLFAAKDCATGVLVCILNGTLYRKAPSGPSKHYTFFFGKSDMPDGESEGGYFTVRGVGRNINSSCKPNCFKRMMRTAAGQLRVCLFTSVYVAAGS